MKISYDIINKLREATGTQIDLLLHIGQFQDKKATAGGFDYRTICESICTKKSTYYVSTHGMAKKGFISFTGSERDNWTFTILNNEAALNGGRYMSLDYELIHSKEFINLKKNEKIICLKLIEMSNYGSKQVELKFSTMCDLTGVALKTVLGYVESLKAMFKDMCTLKDDRLCIINKLNGHEAKIENKTSPFAVRKLDAAVLEKVQFLKHYCKQHKLKYDEKELEDTAGLFKQYDNLIPRESKDEKDIFVLEKITTCIKENKRIIAAYINTLISNTLKEPPRDEEDAVYIPQGYKDNFIPYIYCYERKNMRNRLEELLYDIDEEYCNNQAAREVLRITKDNLVAMLTTTGTIKAKNARFTNRQIYDRLMAVSLDGSKTATPEQFISFIKEFIAEVVKERHKYSVKVGIEGYLQTWLIDTMNKRLSYL